MGTVARRARRLRNLSVPTSRRFLADELDPSRVTAPGRRRAEGIETLVRSGQLPGKPRRLSSCTLGRRAASGRAMVRRSRGWRSGGRRRGQSKHTESGLCRSEVVMGSSPRRWLRRCGRPGCSSSADSSPRRAGGHIKDRSCVFSPSEIFGSRPPRTRTRPDTVASAVEEALGVERHLLAPQVVHGPPDLRLRAGTGGGWHLPARCRAGHNPSNTVIGLTMVATRRYVPACGVKFVRLRHGSQAGQAARRQDAGEARLRPGMISPCMTPWGCSNQCSRRWRARWSR